MGTIWELDFYSRPIVDDQQKKVWEVLVCESPLDSRTPAEDLFRYAQWCPNSQVNSVWLRTALEEAIAKAPRPPQKIRFFRRQMAKMITKACDELGIAAQPSRRTFTLDLWLRERMQLVYPNQPGFVPLPPNPSVQMQSSPPQRLPDALIGQQWAFVNLEASAFEEMQEWDIDFGEAFPIVGAAYGGQPIEETTPIPGVVIFSPRAKPLAGWMSGIEPAFLKFDKSPARLLLESGGDESWVLANIKDPQIMAEAKGFEEAKHKAGMVHFIAVQSNPQSESFAGFWLLKEINVSS